VLFTEVADLRPQYGYVVTLWLAGWRPELPLVTITLRIADSIHST